ncbi:hypothetical protein FH972_002078 [Carpinus fangiana]|uniref:Uncharacterized protein n=1 Tax=Carpinus fangiana TaxID=176857 RepID=A0A5N6QH09_9ROSI|nr:hypothetical protein FH972_002078 [Carpinus fangiana]
MIEQKIPKIIPKTPIRTPPGEPETINAWELMEGLEDVSPLRSPLHLRSFSFDIVRNPNPNPIQNPLDCLKSRFQENGAASPKPMWLQMGEGEPVISDFDLEVISTFRKSLQELPSNYPFHLRQLDNDKQHHQQVFAEADNEMKVNGTVGNGYKCENDKVVLYFTSLRRVRKTYEDCC